MHAGAHTFGRVQCRFVTARLYNFSGTNRPDPTLDRGPRGGNASALNDLDPTTPDAFDSDYYTSIEARRGTLQSDQELRAVDAHGADRPPLRRQPEGVLQELRQVHDQHGEHPGADGESG